MDKASNQNSILYSLETILQDQITFVERIFGTNNHNPLSHAQQYIQSLEKVEQNTELLFKDLNTYLISKCQNKIELLLNSNPLTICKIESLDQIDCPTPACYLKFPTIKLAAKYKLCLPKNCDLIFLESTSEIGFPSVSNGVQKIIIQKEFIRIERNFQGIEFQIENGKIKKSWGYKTRVNII